MLWQQKEENLDKKNDKIERLEESLQSKNKKAEEKLAEAEAIKKSQMDILEKISGFTLEQAKEHLLSMLDSELSHEKALKINGPVVIDTYIYKDEVVLPMLPPGGSIDDIIVNVQK